MARESEAERSLRELQEGMAARDAAARGRTSSASSSAPAPASPSPAAPDAAGNGPTRRWPLFVGLAVVVVLALAAAAGAFAPGLVGGGESRDEVSGSYEDADFATTYDEATPEQAERGRQATASAEELDVPAAWRQDDDQTDLSMRDDGESVSAIYGTAYEVPADYTAEDFTAWFEGNQAVRASDPDDVSCTSENGGEQVFCDLVLASGGIGDDPDGPRLTVGASFFAGTGADDPASVLISGYSL